jgi:hypothetical protein
VPWDVHLELARRTAPERDGEPLRRGGRRSGERRSGTGSPTGDNGHFQPPAASFAPPCTRRVAGVSRRTASDVAASTASSSRIARTRWQRCRPRRLYQRTGWLLQREPRLLAARARRTHVSAIGEASAAGIARALEDPRRRRRVERSSPRGGALVRRELFSDPPQAPWSLASRPRRGRPRPDDATLR